MLGHEIHQLEAEELLLEGRINDLRHYLNHPAGMTSELTQLQVELQELKKKIVQHKTWYEEETKERKEERNG